MAHHEHCDKDEIWVGNTLSTGENIQWLKEKGMKTLRLGNIAYDVFGKPLSEKEGYSPLFINRSEENFHNELMMTRTFGPNWRRG